MVIRVYNYMLIVFGYMHVQCYFSPCSLQPVIIIHEAKYFIVTSASIIIRPKTYQFHDARDIPNSLLITLSFSGCRR